MPERSIRAIISVAAIIIVAWLGAAAAARFQGTAAFWSAVAVTILLIGGIIAYALHHAWHGRDERISRGTDHGSRIRRGTQQK